MKESAKLWVVMPVYNEQEAVPKVIDQWIPVLKECCGEDFVLCAINDGSKDNTLELLKQIASKESQLLVFDKPNSGHGQSCLWGYQKAIDAGAEWIFQIDSDGQCDPRFFAELLKKTENHRVVYGFRRSRADGLKRYLISRIVSLFALSATGVWVKDANVPYRLMHRDTLINIIPGISKEFNLANIFVSVLQQKYFGITWINIHFLNRIGGTPSVKTFSFVKHGFKLFKQLKKNVKAYKSV